MSIEKHTPGEIRKDIFSIDKQVGVTHKKGSVVYTGQRHFYTTRNYTYS